LISNNINELKRLSNLKKESTSTTLRYAQGQVDYLIVGQGISGTWLSYYLQKENKTFVVIDNNEKNAASRLASGIINPVTGRRHVEVWMADELLPFALNAYSTIGKELGITAITETKIIDQFPTAQMRLSFQQRVEEKANYVSLEENMVGLNDHFHYEFGYGTIEPVYLAQLPLLLPAWREKLRTNGQLLEEEFSIDVLEFKNGKIAYKDIVADKIIFCDGISSASYTFFRNLPFAPNKGEALIVEIDNLPTNLIYKKGMTLVPLTDNTWWVGSNYIWDFTDTEPTTEFREKTEQLMKNWLKLPYRVLDHVAGVRPATLERRPFVGLHPQQPIIGILNGMGSKGCSLAPFFTKQLADHLVQGKSLLPEADIMRFAKILAR
jgi:glycine/D-amino acid oxidase-like deaminating enzyme